MFAAGGEHADQLRHPPVVGVTGPHRGVLARVGPQVVDQRVELGHRQMGVGQLFFLGGELVEVAHRQPEGAAGLVDALAGVAGVAYPPAAVGVPHTRSLRVSADRTPWGYDNVEQTGAVVAVDGDHERDDLVVDPGRVDAHRLR